MRKLIATLVSVTGALAVVGLVDAQTTPVVYREHNVSGSVTNQFVVARPGTACLERRTNSPTGSVQRVLVPAGATFASCTPAASTTTTVVPASTSIATSTSTSTPITSTTAVITTTTTTSSPPTTTAPSGALLVEDFSTATGFSDRFDTHTGNYCTEGVTCRPEENGGVANFPGSHSMACAAPPSQRDVDVSDHGNLFWHCAPGGPSTGHMMVANNTGGYAVSSFSPKQSFVDVNEVCWDMSLADVGGGKWMNVVLVPEATFVSHPNLNPHRVHDGEGPYRMDYVTPDFAAPGGPGSFNIQNLGSGAGAIVGVKQFRGTTEMYRGNSTLYFDYDSWTAGADESTRYRHCFRDNGNGTLTYTQMRGTGLETRTTAGSFPNGAVRVLFQDDTYDADKHGGTGRYTWHVDNILISR